MTSSLCSSPLWLLARPAEPACHSLLNPGQGLARCSPSQSGLGHSLFHNIGAIHRCPAANAAAPSHSWGEGRAWGSALMEGHTSESNLCPHQRGPRQELSGDFYNTVRKFPEGPWEGWSTLGGMPQNSVPRTAITNYHKCSTSQSRNVFFHHSERATVRPRGQGDDMLARDLRQHPCGFFQLLVAPGIFKLVATPLRTLPQWSHG